MQKTTTQNTTIKNQQAGRRLSGNQQRELTKEQTKHPERVESTAEKMQDEEKRRSRKSARRKLR